MWTINDQPDPEDQPILRGELDALLANNQAIRTLQEEIEVKMRREWRREMDERLGDGSQTEDSEREALLPNNNIRLLQAMNDLAGAAIEAHVQEHTPRRQEHIVQHDREETEQMRLGGREEDPNLLSNNAQIIQALNIAPLEDPPVDRRGVEEDIELVAIGHAPVDAAAAPPLEVMAPPPAPPQQQRYLSMVGRLLGVGSVSPRTDLHTGTFGMYAVAAAVHPSARTTHRARAWLVAAGMLFFVILQLFVFSTVDIEEASIEEIVLDHHVKDTLNRPAEVVRVALRIRKFIIPFMATSSTIILLITNPVSSSSIILNLLAISIILEADNVVAVLFLSRHHDAMMNAVVRDVDGGAFGDAHGSFFWSRVQGLLCAVILVGAMVRIDHFVTTCGHLEWFLYAVVFWPALSIIVGKFICFIICARRNGPSLGEKILGALIECIRNLFALSITFTICNIFEIMRYGRGNYWPMLFSVIRFTFPFLDEMNEEDVIPARKYAYVSTMVFLLMVVGLSMLRKRWYGRADREQTERTNQHGTRGVGHQVV
mmetsp:Transcript_9324/g.19005  ORF Transcript_9324/g.19005 Transcript_9324/m.19005 type:complete len:542 (-) Transcript_9324:86-1711(-)